MSSLQEQLLKAGLVDEKKLARAKQEKSKQANQARKKRGNKGQPSEASRQPLQNKKAERDRELNRQRQQQARQKELAAQATQLIVNNRLERAQGDQPYGFVYKRKIKKIYVTEAQKKQLAEGQLAIATHVATDGRRFELVPKAVAEKIGERDGSFLVAIDPPAESSRDENDPYADYEVPDDLIW
ncbi:MAG TPA: DUF2058 domain-containing protein [Gammaproteobacteria bacterium]|nr:DUF2058 domain-containing protein [Gammaproteobacteria bacterium]